MTQQLLEAYDTLFASLWDRMSMMLGRITTHNLMERALFLTANEAPLASEIILQPHALDFSSLKARVGEIPPQELRNMMNALVVNVVGVLAEQVGRAIADSIAKKAVSPGVQENER